MARKTGWATKKAKAAVKRAAKAAVKRAAKAAVKRAAKAAKRTGPSRRTAAERGVIDRRAAKASATAKRAQRSASKVERALLARCPTCHAKPGVQCFDRKGKQVPTPHRLRLLAAPRKGKTEAERIASAVKAPDRPAHDVSMVMYPVEWIKIGLRHRVDFSHVPELMTSINERGGLLQPISIRPDNTLIDGESRIRAWKLSRFAGQPIPVHIIDVDSIIAGEFDANARRKDFTLSEAVAIKKDIEQELKRLAAAQPKEAKPAPGRKASGPAAGRVGDKVAAFTGKKRRTLEKAEAVIEAAEREPEKFGKLREDMDRTNRADAPYRRLKVLTQAAEIRNAPPQLPMKGPYRGGIIDPPWPAEPEEDDPERLARGYYPYPTMSIDALAALDVPSILHADCLVGLWITNFHLALGHHLPLLAAWGLRAVTIRTWVKDRMGRGSLRGQTEHMVICRRGSPTIEANNLTTFFHAAVNAKVHSQKPQKAYDDFVRLVASERYFSLFETTDRGAQWDCHGDQVGKFAPAIARAAEGELIAEAKGEAPAEASSRPRASCLRSRASRFGATRASSDWSACATFPRGLSASRNATPPEISSVGAARALRQAAF